MSFFATTCLFAGLFGGYYSAWKEEAACREEVAEWTYDDEVDPSVHAVVWYQGRHHALVDHTVTNAPCILKLHDTLRARGYVYPATQSRRLSDSVDVDFNLVRGASPRALRNIRLVNQEISNALNGALLSTTKLIRTKLAERDETHANTWPELSGDLRMPRSVTGATEQLQEFGELGDPKLTDPKLADTKLADV